MPTKSGIGATAVQVTGTSTPVQYGVLCVAPASNTATVYVGYANTVTAGPPGTNDATTGVPLPPGAAHFFPAYKLATGGPGTANANVLYAISTTTAQAIDFFVDEDPRYGPAGGSGGSGGDVDATTYPGGASFATAVTTSGAYADGDVIGGIISIANMPAASGGIITLDSLNITDANGNTPALNVYLFGSTPSGGTYTDNAALVWGASDKAIPRTTLLTESGDWMADASQTTASYGPPVGNVKLAATTLFVLIVATGAVTYTNGNLYISGTVKQWA